MFLIRTDCYTVTTIQHRDLLQTTSTRIELFREILDRKRAGRQSHQSIDEVIEDASEPGTFSSATFLPDQGAIAYEGDMLMRVPQFTEMQQDAAAEEMAHSMNLVREAQALDETLHKRFHFHWPEVHLQQHNGHIRRKRAARRTERRYWPDGVIPLRLSGRGFRRRETRRMARGLNQISEKTCICFRRISRSAARRKVPHVRVLEGRGCRSFVGMSVREQHSTLSQDLVLGKRCRTSIVFSHEILHAIGLFHEHARPDRDKYVEILLQNAVNTSLINFNRISSRAINTRGVDYDYLSIMHYGSRAFSKNGDFTIVPRPDTHRKQYLNRIGRARRISEKDAEVINLMYNCSMPRPCKPTCSEYPYRL
ncbi:zinc metalloproteinase nas-1-like [Mizuhopecten yessoensis]|uniref:zinc metalloproteinase nas-1-like n=1 Tax=Mizuhopecten yessoensis TaxID=6573 RepID=UPI000B45ECCD|nr:zinc metalloproteinase nas-1-like [Mizuhopecten yessoensis]